MNKHNQQSVEKQQWGRCLKEVFVLCCRIVYRSLHANQVAPIHPVSYCSATLDWQEASFCQLLA